MAVENAVLDMDTPKTMEEIIDMMAKTVKGEIKQSRQNCNIIFREDPLLKGAFRQNLLTGRIDVVKDLGWQRRGVQLTDSDLNRIYTYVEFAYCQKNDKYMKAGLQTVAEDNAYHPIKDLLLSLKWDGVERVRYALHHFLGATADDYAYEILKLFMLGAICRVFNPGCKFEVMLCLVGGQGAGKSTFFRLLAMNDEWFSDDLKRLDDENVVRKMQGHWIIEMSEMIATANARSIEDIKSFLSRQKETYKVPYATEPEDRLRQCVFGGTSNTIKFLPLDRSGNRRFLPILCCGEEAEVHILEDESASRAYIAQMWAEVMEIYRSGKYKLSLPEKIQGQLFQYQQEFMPEDTDAGMIAAYLEDLRVTMVCTKLLYDKALHRDVSRAKRYELNDIADIMNNSFPEWVRNENPRMFPEYGKQKYWSRPESDGFMRLSEAEQMKLPFD
jgi:predicted P-loop ATPase